jgi:tripartite-type tricarboxylate transporter receptor subunit TctC
MLSIRQESPIFLYRGGLMLILRYVVWMIPVGLVVLGAGVASGQNYPNKTIRIVTHNPGGSTDVAARIIAQGISGPLGQPVIVDNRGSGILPIELVSKAPADGHTLLVGGVIYTIGHLLQETSYDPVKDFEPISMIGISPQDLVVHPSVPVKTVKELIALAKAKPGVLNYATGGLGGGPHLATELFKSMAGGLNIVRINYKGGPAALNGLIGGETDMLIIGASVVAPLLNSGRLRALAVTSAQPSLLAPGLPTIAASGLPGYESAQFSVIVAPAKTPATIIKLLNQEIVRVLTRPEVKQKFLDVGVEVVASSPEQLGAATRAEIARLDKVIKDAGIKAE